ncbi:MAG: extracellular solute-binding protein [Clostridia bacterium]|nr:extracellular solute-binding protein [Clostridia bacterium]
MKKILFKSVALALTGAMLVSSFSFSAFAENDGGDTASAPSSNELTSMASSEKTGTEYSSYLEKIGEVESSEETATAKASFKVGKGNNNFSVDIKTAGLYNMGFSYKTLSSDIIEFGVKVDGKFPFDEAKKLTLQGIYENAEGGNRKDGLGNEFAPKQVLSKDFYFDTVKDITKWSADDYYFYLTPGAHKFEIVGNTGSFEVEKVVFSMSKNVEKYQKPEDSSEFYKGDRIVIEGEDAVKKTSYWLASKADNSSLDVTPNDAYKTLANYIGGGNWEASGQTLTWTTPEVEEGYYKLGFSYRQSAVLGSKVYRSLKIDGETPFAEAENVGFKYSYDWQQLFFSNRNEKPYLIYLTAGTHEISLTVVPGEVNNVRNKLKDAVAELGKLYVDITMITGESVDIYRDYNLFEQIPDMQERLKSIYMTLNSASKELQKITGEKTGSYVSIIDSMKQICKLMYKNRYTAHRYKSEYYSKYTSLASVLFEMSSMPLDLDKMVLCSPAEEEPFDNAGVFKKIAFSFEKFFVSFTQDYNNISGLDEDGENITIWVNWGRDQAQVLNSLIQTEFSNKTNIGVNVQLVNASIVQAVLSGKGPDCLIQHSRSEPVNLAMRGMLYDLKSFDDCDEVLKNFHEGAELPYYYKGGLYGLPDTQQFYMLFYRTDIFKQMGLKVPNTWDQFEETVKLLARNNLTAWLPNNTATSVAQANIGIGSINLFPSLLLQKNLEVYANNGKKTNLTDSDVVVAFNEWTDLYSCLKLPRTLDFYNRFRTGTCPIGVSTYTLYTTLKAAAPEIDGLWNVALLPGTVGEDGKVNHTSSGGGSACSILNLTKNPKASWEFLKWWVSDETQLAYSSEVESILGPTGRVSVSNVDAFKAMEWDAEMKDVIVESLNSTGEIPEYPGSYYVSRSVYQAFWNVVENNQNPKDTLLKYAEEADEEIARKWKQYENR